MHLLHAAVAEEPNRDVDVALLLHLSSTGGG